MNKLFIITASAVMMTSAASAEKNSNHATAPVTKKSETAKVDSVLMQQLQEIQVVSTRATKKTPVAFYNVNKDLIKSLNYGKDLPELLQLTPSVTTTSDAGNGIGYTSMRVRGTDPSRINVTVNGIPLNDAESSTVFWVNFNDIMSSAQSVQIQRGVGTSTNGAGAFGATVNILTEPVGNKPFVGIDLSGGSYYSHKETVRFGTGLINNHWGLQGRLSNIGSKGYLDRASTKLNSYFLQAGYFGDKTVVKFITFNGIEQTYHAWNYTSKYEQAINGRTYNSCGAMTWNADWTSPTSYYDGQKDNYHSNNFQIIWNQKFNNSWNMNLAAHYTRGDGYYEDYNSDKKLYKYGLSTDKTYKTDNIDQQKMANDFYGFVASLNYNNHKNLTLNIGGGWNQYDGDNFGKVIWVKQPSDIELTPDFEYYRNNAMKTDFNIYAKANYEFFKGFSAFVDLQYRGVIYNLQDPSKSYFDPHGNKRNLTGTYVMKNNYNFFNPKFGVNYDINTNHRVYISYGISHKEPVRNNFQEYWAPAEQGKSAAYPKAERLNDLEIGYNYKSRNFSAGVNVYYMDYKDQFVLTGAINAIGEALTANLDKSYRLGVEVEAGWKVSDWFRWDLNATWSRNRVKDMEISVVTNADASDQDNDVTQPYVISGETPLSFSPDFIMNNIFTFTYKGFKGAIQSNYTSKQYLTNTGFETYSTTDALGNLVNVDMMLEGHFTTNLELDYTFKLKKIGMKDLTVGVTLYNIFSCKYDNNGWASPKYRVVNGQLEAYYNDVANGGAYNQCYSGFAPSAPFNLMGHLSVNF